MRNLHETYRALAELGLSADDVDDLEPWEIAAMLRKKRQTVPTTTKRKLRDALARRRARRTRRT